MSESVRFVFPKPKLAKLLQQPGGLPVAEALERAQNNLEAIKPTCLAELQALLELTEARFEAMGGEFEEAPLAELYAIAVRGIGGGEVCGTPGVDQALTSLCDLLDNLRTSQRYDRAAIGVHVQAWRLLLAPENSLEASRVVVEGLRKVSARYAA
ncbi:hypothetical protein [Phenylobacterium sp.]|jgi:hypothetical protein|uniref:hypothetical protein n=1 Tax=Phenylobacterium sp. TaxID=1871053 RepID=UPI002F94E4AA